MPILPAVVMILRLLAGEEQTRGAVSCAGLLGLSQIEEEFSSFHIHTRVMSRRLPAGAAK